MNSNSYRDFFSKHYTLADTGQPLLPEYAPLTQGGLYLDEHLLAIASQMGLREGESVHRLALILAAILYERNASLESYQNAIENSRYFRRTGRGQYMIVPPGNRIIEECLAIPFPVANLSRRDVYIVSRTVRSMEVTAIIRCNVTSCSRTVMINGRPVSPGEAMARLQAEVIDFRTPSSRSTHGVLNWILETEGFSLLRYTPKLM